MTTPSLTARLVHSNGQEIEIKDELTIGRQEGSTIRIEDTRVSRQHATVAIQEDSLVIRDLGSHNGTFVNDQRITGTVRLNNGDKVRIGRSNFVVRLEVSPAAGVEEPVQPIAPVRDSGTITWEMAIPLTLVRGDGVEFGLNNDSTIGRDPGNQVVLEKDANASLVHARLDIQDNKILVTDLGSHNGTWVNGRRITEPVLLQHGDRIRIGNTLFRLRVGDNPLPQLDKAQAEAEKGRTWKTSLGVSLGVTFSIILCVGLIVLGAWGIPRLIGKTSPTPTDHSSIGSLATQEYQAKQTALRAVVWIVVPDRETESTGMVHTGTGSLLNEEGYVLTNNHVIEENIGTFLIGLNWSDPTDEPNIFYECELIVADPRLDLAVLHVIALEGGRPLPADLVFPFLPVGDSDEVHIGDAVTIIGFPGIGGESPTLTAGTVSGFSTDEYNRIDHGWIKTDALISWGNSGGMAVNTQGELIGIPTQFTEESMEDRPLDTFLGELRPINIALPLIEDYIHRLDSAP